jgi:hypothetical protein
MMPEYSKFERASDLSGLLKAASFMSTAIEAHDIASLDGLAAILNVAEPMAGDIAEEAELAERSAGRVLINEMQGYSKYDRASDLWGLIKAASFMSTAIEPHLIGARDGFAAVLNVAERMAGDIAEEAELAERSAGQVVIDER